MEQLKSSSLIPVSAHSAESKIVIVIAKEIELLRKTLLHVQQLDFKCGECEDEFNTASGSEI